MAPGKNNNLNNKSNLGKSLQRRKKYDTYTSNRHTSDIEQHQTVSSITEQTSLDDFLSNAEASRRNFEAERGQAAIAGLGVVPEGQEHDPNFDEDIDENVEDDETEFCSIPKKPKYDVDDTAETFKQKEVDSFLKWKRSLSRLQAKNPSLPPFERNIEFWRQLWKIIELSDVIIQVVDARDPLYYSSSDLANYVKEIDPKKESVLLLNKADLLTAEQRQSWSKYFMDSDMKALFFSATIEDYDEELEQVDDDIEKVDFGSHRILRPDQILNVMKSLKDSNETVTVGFTGYPNVGKSSTINRFLSTKMLKTSATPGKTKHYQTHLVGGSCTFIDGPGLVIPNLTMTRASMVLSGILPIDTLTEYNSPMDLLVQKIPFAQLLDHYGIVKSSVMTAKRSDRNSSVSFLFLSSFGVMRGLVKAAGNPDTARCARIVLKDFVQGKLIFCQAPPTENQAEFCKFETKCDDEIFAEEDLELVDSFPELKMASGVHMKGKRQVAINGNALGMAPTHKKHGNKKKKEKLRRLYNESPYA